jgi:hypothetical protein
MFTQSLLSNSCRIVACLAFVAYHCSFLEAFHSKQCKGTPPVLIFPRTVLVTSMIILAFLPHGLTSQGDSSPTDPTLRPLIPKQVTDKVPSHPNAPFFYFLSFCDL